MGMYTLTAKNYSVMLYAIIGHWLDQATLIVYIMLQYTEIHHDDLTSVLLGVFFKELNRDPGSSRFTCIPPNFQKFGLTIIMIRDQGQEIYYDVTRSCGTIKRIFEHGLFLPCVVNINAYKINLVLITKISLPCKSLTP